MSSAGNGKKKLGKLKGYQCFTRVDNAGATYTTCRDDEQQLRIASAKKKRELYKKPTKPLVVKKKKTKPPSKPKPAKPKVSPKPKRPRGRPKLPPKVKPPPKKRGRKAGGKNKPKPKADEDLDDDEVPIKFLYLSENKDGVKWRGEKPLYIESDGKGNVKTKIWSSNEGKVVGKKIFLVSKGDKKIMYKITDEQYALEQQKGTTRDLRFFGKIDAE